MDANLVMFRPNGQRKDFPLIKNVTVIGRGENCDLRIPLGNVSRRHCEITLAGDEVKAKDLASSNGTYVDNKRINECALAAGNRLVIGPVVFTVQIDGVPEQIEPVKTKAQRAATEGAGEEIVELEADVLEEGEDVDIDVLAAAAEEDTGEIDPIAALEALAAEGEDRKENE